MSDKPAWADFEPNEDDHGDVTEMLCSSCKSGYLLSRGKAEGDLRFLGHKFECSECRKIFFDAEPDDDL